MSINTMVSDKVECLIQLGAIKDSCRITTECRMLRAIRQHELQDPEVVLDQVAHTIICEEW